MNDVSQSSSDVVISISSENLATNPGSGQRGRNLLRSLLVSRG
jgi:hypothetical protein